MGQAGAHFLREISSLGNPDEKPGKIEIENSSKPKPSKEIQPTTTRHPRKTVTRDI